MNVSRKGQQQLCDALLCDALVQQLCQQQSLGVPQYASSMREKGHRDTCVRSMRYTLLLMRESEIKSSLFACTQDGTLSISAMPDQPSDGVRYLRDGTYGTYPSRRTAPHRQSSPTSGLEANGTPKSSCGRSGRLFTPSRTRIGSYLYLENLLLRSCNSSHFTSIAVRPRVPPLSCIFPFAAQSKPTLTFRAFKFKRKPVSAPVLVLCNDESRCRISYVLLQILPAMFLTL